MVLQQRNGMSLSLKDQSGCCQNRLHGCGVGGLGGIKGERLLKGSSKNIQASNSTRGVG